MRPVPQLSPCSITEQSMRRRCHTTADRETERSLNRAFAASAPLLQELPPSRSSPGRKPSLPLASTGLRHYQDGRKKDFRSSMEVAVRGEAEGDCARRGSWLGFRRV
ncbi:hypothetical protein V8G54_002818 [Vigna mungo]|uniref:Uncharacterized protein n=1 Tax=Vigna mungo TaxID=3915 RepID=A0AAQ3SDE6_VIGMU